MSRMPWNPYHQGVAGRVALGAVGSSVLGTASDPVLGYGVRAARVILGNIQQLPPTSRKAALKALLDRIDPSLFASVSVKAERLMAKGTSAAAALESALAISMANGFGKEILQKGQGRQVATGYVDCGSVASDFLNAVGGAAKDVLAKTEDTLKGVACTALKSPAAAAAVTAGAAAAGVPPFLAGPAAAMGTSFAAGKVCPSAAPAPTAPAEPTPVVVPTVKGAGAGMMRLGSGVSINTAAIQRQLAAQRPMLAAKQSSMMPVVVGGGLAALLLLL